MRVDKFINSLSGRMLLCGRYRAHEVFYTLLRKIDGYCSHVPPSLGRVYSKPFLLGFREYLFASGLSANTVSFYFTALRSVYSLAVGDGRLRYDSDLFSVAPCGSVPTAKRAVSPETIALIHGANLSGIPRLEFCRDLFMLSVHLQGISFIDLLHLRKSDVHGDYLTYRRRKTGGVVCVSLCASARELIDKLSDPSVDSPYILPLITLSGADGWRQYQSALRLQNRRLKSLAAHLGIVETLTSYVARHSWATIAFHNNVPAGLVGQALGHCTEEVTRIYLSSFTHEHLAEANRVVLHAILRPILEGRVVGVREEVQDEVARELGTPDVSTRAVTDRKSVVNKHVPEYPAGNSLKRGKWQQGGRLKAKNVHLCSRDGR